jgi:hypothetical protein
VSPPWCPAHPVHPATGVRERAPSPAQPLPLADASDIGIALTAEELAEFDGRFLPDSTER